MNDRPPPGSRYTIPTRYREADAKPSARRSTLRALPLLLGAIAGIALVVLVMSLLSQRPGQAQNPSVAPTARQLCDDLTTQRYDDLYGLLAPALQTVGSRAQFVASQRQLDAQLGTARACSYSIAGQDAASATLTLTVTRGASAATSGQVRLTYEGTHWRIADFDSSLVAAPADQFSRVRSMSAGG